jgi:hypothetical protein
MFKRFVCHVQACTRRPVLHGPGPLPRPPHPTPESFAVLLRSGRTLKLMAAKGTMDCKIDGSEVPDQKRATTCQRPQSASTATIGAVPGEGHRVDDDRTGVRSGDLSTRSPACSRQSGGGVFEGRENGQRWLQCVWAYVAFGRRPMFGRSCL